ncbi:DgyrCDS4201 [Dimorphilus gyrociliatus]|uniref:Large ribosomal subunit protein uL29m n=1 Tax=Dimorphilus gyrociliatus TaxID=2664684 RepID=A0A7I8VFS7_9ANNE|nr:DgyrCDS4201 [Dimorphilus gyrociliatus]
MAASMKCAKTVLSSPKVRTFVNKTYLRNNSVYFSTSSQALEKAKSPPGLDEFFDAKENWNESTIKVGRPWLEDELRLKSNEDLHKLWYILLKERNMIMTMAEEYKRTANLMPAPERQEKVEESMENLLTVIRERDRAVNVLNTGETGDPGKRCYPNELGIVDWRYKVENYRPLHLRRWRLEKHWSAPLIRLLKERKFKKAYREKKLKEKKKEDIRKRFPSQSDLEG